MSNICYVYECNTYDIETIFEIINDKIQATAGEKVFIKPNWVMHPLKNNEDRWIATVTNSALIDAVLKSLYNKMKGKGHIIIGDSPMGFADIKIILSLMQIDSIINKYCTEEFQIEVIDIRNYYLKEFKDMIVQRVNLKGDPRGNRIIALEDNSLFYDKENKEYGFVDNVYSVSDFHNDKHNKYVISQSVLECNYFINLPKLKTHRSAGITCAMKNLVGITANKNSIPHRTKGSDLEGGDTYSHKLNKVQNIDDDSKSFIRKIIQINNPIINYSLVPIKIIYNKINKSSKVIPSGYWHGNKTIYRSIIDLNRILLYCDRDGNMNDTVQRRYLSIADAIIAGDGEGPLIPTIKKCNLLLISDNPVTLDTVACQLIGFKLEKLPFLYESYKDMKWPLVNFNEEEVKIISDLDKWNNRYAIDIKGEESFQFMPVEGWKGYVENY